MSIRDDVKILHELKQELNILSKRQKDLRIKYTVVEKQIVRYLTENNLPGVRYKSSVVLLEKKSVACARNPKETKKTIESILAGHGIDDAKLEYVYKQILCAGKTSDKKEISNVRFSNSK